MRNELANAGGAPPAGTIRAWLQLTRVPNLFTVVADVLAGYLFAAGNWESPLRVSLLCLMSLAFYTAGLIWNDVWDVEQDRRERPERPIPSGRIALTTARRAAACLSLVGLGGAIAVAAALRAQGDTWSGRVPVLAVVLLVLILSYDRFLKRTFLGPWAMGGCRGWNLLLVLSAARPSNEASAWLGVDSAGWYLIVGYTLYIAGVTQFARREANAPDRLGLAVGWGLMALGLAVWASFPLGGEYARGELRLALASSSIWVLLVSLVAFNILWRCGSAIVERTPAAVQRAVGHAIRSTIVLNASLCLARQTPSTYALAVLALLFPTLLLGRTVKST